MIRSSADYKKYLSEDLNAFGLKKWRIWHGLKYTTLAWQRKLRTAEFMINCAPRPIGLLFRLRVRAAGMKLGFSIPPNVFGPGLCIVHWGTIVVHDKAQVGPRCRIHPCTVIGAKYDLPPTMGSDCYVGPGAKVIGGIILGDRVVVGANAVVTKSFPSGSVLAGVPAKRLEKGRSIDSPKQNDS
jgi:serine O-acetyltransferase